MVTAISKQEKPIQFLGKAIFKANGYTLYRLQSGEKVYEVTLVDGKVTGCQEKDGEICKGRRYTGHCKHGDFVLAKEQENEQEPKFEKLSREAYIAEFNIYG